MFFWRKKANTVPLLLWLLWILLQHVKEYRYFNVTSSEGYPCMLFLWLFIFFFGRQKNITLIIFFVCRIEGYHFVCYVVAWHQTRVSTRLFAQIIVRKYSFPASLQITKFANILPCLAQITGYFFHWTSPNKLKYGKPRLGEPTLA